MEPSLLKPNQVETIITNYIGLAADTVLDSVYPRFSAYSFSVRPHFQRVLISVGPRFKRVSNNEPLSIDPNRSLAIFYNLFPVTIPCQFLNCESKPCVREGTSKCERNSKCSPNQKKTSANPNVSQFQQISPHPQTPHPQIPASSDPHILRSSHPEILTSSDPHILRSRHPQIATSSHVHIRSPHPQVSTSCLHILRSPTSSDLRILRF